MLLCWCCYYCCCFGVVLEYQKSNSSRLTDIQRCYYSFYDSFFDFLNKKQVFCLPLKKILFLVISISIFKKFVVIVFINNSQHLFPIINL